ncbi:MAG: DUF4372 domain-containing protein [Candidatus Cryptobacteroides sp.]|jgi:hypothetical protein
MNKGKYVFSRLLEFLDPFVFLRISKKCGGDKYVKSFSCWNQLAVLMFGQLSNRESLRDVVLATQTLSGKAFHLGFGKYPFKVSRQDSELVQKNDVIFIENTDEHTIFVDVKTTYCSHRHKQIWDTKPVKH